jgi:hypothetical protein
MVASDTRNARAISAVDRPATVRSVSATRFSRAMAGWQHVKTSRSRSSASGSAAARDEPDGPAASATSSTFARSVCRRRSTSRARRRATVVSHAPGERGRPPCGHRARAFSVASCTQSSARSQSPVSRISVATTAARSPATAPVVPTGGGPPSPVPRPPAAGSPVPRPPAARSPMPWPPAARSSASGGVTRRRRARTGAARACRRGPGGAGTRWRSPRRGPGTRGCRSRRSTPWTR